MADVIDDGSEGSAIPKPQLNLSRYPVFLKLTCFAFWLYSFYQLTMCVIGVLPLNTPFITQWEVSNPIFLLRCLSIVWLAVCSFSIYRLRMKGWKYFLLAQIIFSAFDLFIIIWAFSLDARDVTALILAYALSDLAIYNLIGRAIFTTLFGLNKHHYS